MGHEKERPLVVWPGYKWIKIKKNHRHLKLKTLSICNWTLFPQYSANSALTFYHLLYHLLKPKTYNFKLYTHLILHFALWNVNGPSWLTGRVGNRPSWPASQTVCLNSLGRKSRFSLQFLRQSAFWTNQCWKGLMNSPMKNMVHLFYQLFGIVWRKKDYLWKGI